MQKRHHQTLYLCQYMQNIQQEQSHLLLQLIYAYSCKTGYEERDVLVREWQLSLLQASFKLDLASSTGECMRALAKKPGIKINMVKEQNDSI